MTDAEPEVGVCLTCLRTVRRPVWLEVDEEEESGRSQKGIQGPDYILLKILQNFIPSVVEVTGEC